MFFSCVENKVRIQIRKNIILHQIMLKSCSLVCQVSFWKSYIRIFSKTKCCKISLWLGFLLAASLLVRICFDVLINFLFLFWGQKKIENTSLDQSGRLSGFTWWDCQQRESRHGIMNNFQHKNGPFWDISIDL